MLWVLKVSFEEMTNTEVAKPRRKLLGGMGHFRATSIEVLQFSGEANARLFSENFKAPEQQDQHPFRQNDSNECRDPDPFFAGMPTDLTLDDCIINKSRDKTIEGQRVYFSEKMRRMARHGFDDEDGWEFYCKTSTHSVRDENQLDVYARKVVWSSAHQLRSAIETDLSIQTMFDSVQRGWIRHDTEDSFAKLHGAGAQKSVFDRVFYPFIEKGRNSFFQSALQYCVLKFPWPLSERDYFIVQDYDKALDDLGDPYFVFYNHSVEHPYFAPRQGFVRAIVRYQGLVGVSIHTSKARGQGAVAQTRLTWLFNCDFGGNVPSSFILSAVCDYMIIPYVEVCEAQTRRLSEQGLRPSELETSGHKDYFIANMPKDLSIKDCLVDDLGHGKPATIEAQRKYFEDKMLEVSS